MADEIISESPPPPPPLELDLFNGRGARRRAEDFYDSFDDRPIDRWTELRD